MALPGAAYAQVPPAAPNSIPTREQLQIPDTTAAPPPATAKVESQGAVTAPPCPLEASPVRVTISHVRFVGPGGAPLPEPLPDLLADIAAPAGDQPIRIVCDVRDQAVTALRRAGFLSAVQIPPQQIANSELVLEVITGKLVQVRILGDAGRYSRLLAARAERLKSIYPFNEKEAVHLLLLADDVPGLNVRLAVRPAPSGVTGEVVGDLVASYTPAVFTANVQNYGSRQLGRETGYARADFFGLLGNSDLTSFGVSTTGDFREQQVVQLGHFEGLGAGGVTLGGRVTAAWSRPDLDTLDLRSRSIIGTAELQVPIVRTAERSLRAAAGIDIIEQRTKVYATGVGGVPLNLDKLRVLFARLEANASHLRLDGSERFNLSTYVELRRGVDILGATKRGVTTGRYLPSRFEGDPEATVVRGGADGRIGIGPIFSLASSVQGQYSHKPLLNFEEYSIGNLTIGRGYDPGSNSADAAVGLRTELRARLPFRTTRANVELFGFYDNVWLWNRDLNTTEDDRHLRSFGGGMRFRLQNLLYLEAMYAHPQDRALNLTNTRPPSDRVLFSLTTQFAPRWR